MSALSFPSLNNSVLNSVEVAKLVNYGERAEVAQIRLCINRCRLPPRARVQVEWREQGRGNSEERLIIDRRNDQVSTIRDKTLTVRENTYKKGTKDN